MSAAVQPLNLVGPGKRMKRRPELDALRGLMLVWMTLTHLPTIASVFTNQPLGFVSASEGFIFLSALFTGSVYYGLAQREGDAAMYRKLAKRTLRLYAYHLLLIAFAFLVAARFASPDRRPGLYNLLDFYFAAGPKRAFLDAALLIYRPALLDILPLYILFLAMSMVAFFLARRIGWKPILAGGFALWLAAQFGFRQALYDFLCRNAGLRVPFSDLGAFDLWAWQFLWLLGLWCGTRWAEGRLPVEKWARRIVVPAMFLVPILLVFRWMVGNGIELGNFEVMFDKWHSGAVRLVNFAAIAALAIRFQGPLARLAIAPLVLLGRASIQVFCAHLFFCFLGLAIMGTRSMVKGWQQGVLILLTLSALYVTARIFSKSKAPARANAR
jgi:hypothetical protein